ncbi:hypothetical protein CEXT_499511 [Caerostris extrusa]|uniref:Uncharacterized protein n=1 Tax=Caerostris extrusa TaxID=172846 RepID=A0AAV4Y879_CAEEX|nr:hypothetical protein CEXT_499511 [Caerostris extrusa]
MQKIKYCQLRNTPAQKLRHRIALGFSLGSLAVSLLVGYLFLKVNPDPGKSLRGIPNPKVYMRQIGWKPLMEKEISHGEEDE